MNASQQPPTLSYAYPPAMALGPQGSSSSFVWLGSIAERFTSLRGPTPLSVLLHSVVILDRVWPARAQDELTWIFYFLYSLPGPSAVTTSSRGEFGLQQPL